MKIVYCVNTLSVVGGIEKVTTIKANALTMEYGCEVYIIVKGIKDDIYYPLSSLVKVIPLGIEKSSSRLQNIRNRRLHRKKLEKLLNEISPDIVISTGGSEKYMLPLIKGKWKTIREMHHEKKFFLRFPDSLNGKIRAWLSYIYEYKCRIKFYDAIVSLTKQDKVENWGKDSKVVVIPNMVTIDVKGTNSEKEKVVLALGRLVNQKNFSSLIRAYSYVVQKEPDWMLHIYGDGPQKMQLEKLIRTLKLEKNVKIFNPVKDVGNIISGSAFLALSSIAEGFALVIVEAFVCGVPVVSYDCPCGPKDIIDDGIDGFLVPVNDEKRLAEKMIHLIENPEERERMGNNALIKSKTYSIPLVMSRWMELFSRLHDNSK